VVVTTLSAIAASALAYADGIDISHWQGHVDWTKVRADGITFAFMKATEGSSYADPTLATNWAGAETAGIYRAAYHFARPSTSAGSAQAQARFFVSKAGTFQGVGDLPPVLDLEATGGLSPASLRTWVATWLSTVEQLTGRTPILYFSPSFWIDHLGNSSAFTRYPLWIAHYTTGAPLVPGGWPTWTFWQRTSSGRVSGIGGPVDLNRFNGSEAQRGVLPNSSGGSTTPPPTGPTVPAGAPTALTIAASAGAVSIGSRVALTGSLTTTAPVGPAPGQLVSVWSRGQGDPWRKAAEATTDAAGHYSVTLAVQQSTAYQARTADGAAYAPAVSAPVRVTTPPRRRVALDLRRKPAHVHTGRVVMLYGQLRSGPEGLPRRPVAVLRRVRGGPWVHVATRHSRAPTGWYSLRVHPRGRQVWKAIFAGGYLYAPVTSKTLTVRVR
jgi:GH25 family lysozyme M1 (1,4-beta-N-acetylmuramidase)